MRTQNAVSAARQAPDAQTTAGTAPGESTTPGAPVPGVPREGLSQVTGAFRLPAQPRSGPRLSRLAAVCGWAALIGLLGMAIGTRGLFAVLLSHPPSWYEPTLIAIGLSGIFITAGGLLTVQRRIVPWVLLTLSSAGLVAALVATSMAT